MRLVSSVPFPSRAAFVLLLFIVLGIGFHILQRKKTLARARTKKLKNFDGRP